METVTSLTPIHTILYIHSYTWVNDVEQNTVLHQNFHLRSFHQMRSQRNKISIPSNNSQLTEFSAEWQISHSQRIPAFIYV